MTSINRSSINRNNGEDEVLIKEDFNFYGDLCCFSPSEYNEETISDSYFRFNTAQRELNSNDLSYDNFKTIIEDDLGNLMITIRMASNSRMLRKNVK